MFSFCGTGNKQQELLCIFLLIRLGIFIFLIIVYCCIMEL